MINERRLSLRFGQDISGQILLSILVMDPAGMYVRGVINGEALEVTELLEGEPLAGLPPTLVLDDLDAQGIINALWSLGYRPRDHAEELERLRGDLERLGIELKGAAMIIEALAPGFVQRLDDLAKTGSYFASLSRYTGGPGLSPDPDPDPDPDRLIKPGKAKYQAISKKTKVREGGADV